jgi:hypothetical protein
MCCGVIFIANVKDEDIFVYKHCCYMGLYVYRSGEDGAMDPTQALLSDSEFGVPAAVSVDIDQMPEFKLEQSNTSHPEVCLFLCVCVCVCVCVSVCACVSVYVYVFDLQYF